MKKSCKNWRNHVAIALNVLYLKKVKIYPAYVSKNNSNRQKKSVALSSSKKISALLKGITSKNNSDFYCSNCPHAFKTKDILESNKRVRENKGFCKVVMSSEDTKTFVKTNLEINIGEIKNIIKLEIIVIIQDHLEVLCVAYVIQKIMYLKKCLQFFIMDLTMIIIL